jgi:diketogulonate reductase-like aldo/keto reductase
MNSQDIKSISKKVLKMNSGFNIPVIGLGTYQIKSQEGIDEAVKSAYDAGYRHIDSAVIYKNEHLIGNALKKFSIPREEIFITTKIPTNGMEYIEAKKYIDQSLKNFQTDYIDLYLIHWPGAKSLEDRLGVWRALEESVEEGKVKSIGVSNFLPHHMKTLLENCKIKPAVNQFEIHPLFIDWDLIELCKANNMVIEAYSTFARMDPKLIDNSNLKALCEKYKKSPTSVLVRWAVQHGWVVLPKSVSRQRVFENIDVNEFELTKEDMESLDSLNCCYKVAWDPIKIEF